MGKGAVNPSSMDPILRFLIWWYWLSSVMIKSSDVPESVPMSTMGEQALRRFVRDMEWLKVRGEATTSIFWFGKIQCQVINNSIGKKSKIASNGKRWWSQCTNQILVCVSMSNVGSCLGNWSLRLDDLNVHNVVRIRIGRGCGAIVLVTEQSQPRGRKREIFLVCSLSRDWICAVYVGPTYGGLL
jgi:hypothetical protein